MRRSLNIGKEPNLQKIVLASALMHVLFIALITVPLKTKEREYKTYFVNIVSPTEVQRPSKSPVTRKKTVTKKTVTKKSSVEKKPAPRRKVKPKEAVKEKTVPKKVAPKKGVMLEPDKTEVVSKEIERLRAISALGKKKRAREEEMAAEKEAEEAVAQAIAGIKNRKTISISKGAGIPGIQSSVEPESYYALIYEKIWSEWTYLGIDIPDNSSGLEIIMSISIDRDGNIVSHVIEKSSGDDDFDESAERAIKKASPLPSPPVEMEVGLRFRL